MKTMLRRVAHKIERQLYGGPDAGYTENITPTRFVDTLDDADLERLNDLLPWHAFTADGQGRRFGRVAWKGKRAKPQEIPDRRVLELDKRVPLSGLHVLEVGCFEGIHTVALCGLAARVTAVDARIDNVVKTVVRCALSGCHPSVFKCDVERRSVPAEWLAADVAFHVGVLYHLRDPVAHILELGSLVNLALLLDTHYARDDQATLSYTTAGKEVSYHRHQEGGERDPFSGMYEHAKWLRLNDLVETLRLAHFADVEVVETREERNGPRVLLVARKGLAGS